MIYGEKSIRDILSNNKQQTRRLVKEGEYLDEALDDYRIKVVYTKNGKPKWREFKDYSVQPGRGKKGLWYCPKCKRPIQKIIAQFSKSLQNGTNNTKNKFPWCGICGSNIIPLRIKIVSIKKEKLCDITESDARKEGYEESKEKVSGTGEIITLSAKQNFLLAFGKINNLNFSARKNRVWNPFVWVLEFEVIE